MTEQFYGKMLDVAVELIEKFGGNIILQRQIDGVKDPVTGQWITPPVQDNKTVRGVVTSFPKEIIGSGEGNNRIAATDKRIVIDGRVKPLITDKIDGWSIINITEVKPTSISIVYFIHVRR